MSFENLGIGPKNFLVVPVVRGDSRMQSAWGRDRYEGVRPSAEILFYARTAPVGPSALQLAAQPAQVVVDVQAANLLSALGIGVHGHAWAA